MPATVLGSLYAIPVIVAVGRWQSECSASMCDQKTLRLLDSDWISVDLPAETSVLIR